MSNIHTAYEDDVVKYCMEEFEGDWYLHCELKDQSKKSIIHSCTVFKHLSSECIARGVSKIYAYTPSIHFAEMNGFSLIKKFKYEDREWGHLVWQPD